jgi:hypothetical protein
MTTIDRSRFPCWSCTRPEAIDAKHWLGSASEADFEKFLTPAGQPINCCRVQFVGVAPAGTPAPGPVARRRW